MSIETKSRKHPLPRGLGFSSPDPKLMVRTVFNGCTVVKIRSPRTRVPKRVAVLGTPIPTLLVN